MVGKPQNLVSYHLGELRKAHIVTSRRSSADGRYVYYRADLTRCRNLIGSAGAALHPGLRLTPGTPQTIGHRRRPPRVLFACTGNSARSQIAAALLEHRSGSAIEARSAGSHPKPLHPHAVRVMAERGIDISSNEPTHLSRYSRTRLDRVVTLCDKVREVCPEFSGRPPASHWSLPDPAADGSYEAFVRTACDLEDRIDLLLAELAQPSERSR